MSSKIAKIVKPAKPVSTINPAEPRSRSAAWRITLWGGIAFAIGTAIAFWILQSFLAHDLQNRADSWLTGELGVLADVVEKTPANQLHDAVVEEIAELASREAPHDDTSAGAMNRAVLFLQTTSNGTLKLHTGAGSGTEDVSAIRQSRVEPGQPDSVSIAGFGVPFRVAEARLSNGDRIYLALSTRYERKVLLHLREECFALWCAIICFGAAIVYVSTRRMLHRVHVITETAESIGRTNLGSRIPALARHDEISRLSLTLNNMLDRIESSVQQLHAMSDALAHDLRSPITAVRGKLELALMSPAAEEREEAIIRSIDELDRVTSLLSTSLDVSEASADALRLRKESIDLDATLHAMVELYEPSFAHAGLTLHLVSSGPVFIEADPALLQRTIANLLDNEMKHLDNGRVVNITLAKQSERVTISLEDDGAGFPDDLLPRAFERYIKGPHSQGHGLGLAFVSAVVRSHDGSVIAANRSTGGARILIELPVQPQPEPQPQLASALR